MAVDNKFLIRKIKGLAKAYVMFSRVTRHPFAVCDEETFDDQLWLFSTEESVKDTAQKFLEKGYPIYGVTFEKERLGIFFAEAHALGFNQVVFMDGDRKSCVGLVEIIPEPDFSKLPVERRPVLNPALQLSSLYFMQELSRQIPAEEKTNLQELEEELAANLSKSRLMIPVVGKKLFKPGDKLEKGSFDLTFVKDKEGVMFLPVFSDVLEFNLFNDKKQFQGVVMTIDQLRPLVQGKCEGMIVNPRSMALKLTPKMIDGILKRFFEF